MILGFLKKRPERARQKIGFGTAEAYQCDFSEANARKPETKEKTERAMKCQVYTPSLVPRFFFLRFTNDPFNKILLLFF